MIKILIADDHAIFREGMKQIVVGTKGLAVVGEAENWQELMDIYRKLNGDVVLLDINLPGASGFEGLKQLKEKKPGLPILILSMYPDQQYAIRSLRAGADGYLGKTTAPDELISAIKIVCEGRKYISSAVAEKLVGKLENNIQKPIHELLSKREYQIMCMIADGKTVTNISNQMGLSVKTISTYRVRALQKMKMKTNAELIRYVIKNELVE
jgi:two-component system invasion response regulator UvrY